MISPMLLRIITNQDQWNIFRPCLEALAQQPNLKTMKSAKALEVELPELIALNHIPAVMVFLKAGL